MSRRKHGFRRARVALTFVLALVGTSSTYAAAASASSDDSAAVVKGGGIGVLTDPDGNAFALNSFRVRGTLAEDGSARGRVRFVWRGSFPEVWGDPACAGTCDTITLKGKIESGSIAGDGTVTLVGTAREIDKRRGEVVFDSGFDEPFYVVAGGRLGEDHLILQWCLLPEFHIGGDVRVAAHGDDREGDDEDEVRRTTSSSYRVELAGSRPTPCG